MIYNPLNEPIERRIRLPLYYTGLTDRAAIRREDGAYGNINWPAITRRKSL